jgi:flagellum-specific peptidoglycan hydrolase FlgJ
MEDFMKKIVALLSIFTIFIIFSLITLNKTKEKFLPESIMNIYIKAADEVSQNKLQVNWKYIAALDIVKNEEDFSRVNIKNAKMLGENFLEISKNRKFKNTNYRLLKLDEVMNKKSFSETEKKKVYNYLNKLDDVYPIKPDKYKAQFIEELIPSSKQLYNQYGILPSIVIEQAILESDWERSELSKKEKEIIYSVLKPPLLGKVRF